MQKILTLGIIGGGQLGRMICFYAHRLGFKTVVFSDQENSPASFATNQTIVADYSDKKALEKFAKLVDVVTFEFENIPFETAEFMASQVSFFPSPNILKITQHRVLEKNFLNSIGVKTADYAEISSLPDLQENLKNFGKAILKTATMGYDGKGQFVLKNAEEARNIWPQVASQKLILEKFCPFDSEISVIIARSVSGEVSCYEPLTNIHKNGILDESIYPAKISENLKIKAQEIAKKIAQKLDLIGILAVELFVIGEELLVNELAPRPHNSGHFSMDAAITSQFEQLIRAITDLPLGSSKFHSQGRMKNLIGEEVLHLEKFYQNPRAKIHLYGKNEVKEGRKMGHINILES
jgi:5-(carboxyamino)imidazole ribonucleotide synthase